MAFKNGVYGKIKKGGRFSKWYTENELYVKAEDSSTMITSYYKLYDDGTGIQCELVACEDSDENKDLSEIDVLYMLKHDKNVEKMPIESRKLFENMGDPIPGELIQIINEYNSKHPVK